MTARLCIVTGTTSGIGLALVPPLLEHGWVVLGLARRPAPLTDPAYRHLTVDLSDPAALEACCRGPLAALLGERPWVRLGLVNNAALLGPVGPATGLPSAPLASTFALNVAAPLRLMGCLVGAAGVRPLRVVNVSSGAATRAYPGWSAYCASKAALRAAGQVIAAEAATFPPPGGPSDLSVVSYEPGVVDTAMQAEVRSTPRRQFPALDKFVALHAEGRLVDPRRPAEEIVALLERDGGPAWEERRLGAQGAGRPAASGR